MGEEFKKRPHAFFPGMSQAKRTTRASSSKGSDMAARRRARQNLLACGASNLILLVCLVVVLVLYILKGNYILLYNEGSLIYSGDFII